MFLHVQKASGSGVETLIKIGEEHLKDAVQQQDPLTGAPMQVKELD